MSLDPDLAAHREHDREQDQKRLPEGPIMTETATPAAPALSGAQTGALPRGGASLADAAFEDQGTQETAFPPGAPLSGLPIGAVTHSCGAWWTGARTSHCGNDGCHRTFSSTTAFDRHQRNKPGGGVLCLDPIDAGLVPIAKPYGVLWSCPSNGEGNPYAARGGAGE